MSRILSNNDTIKINFPDDKFQKYLSLLKIEDKKLNLVNIELIFALSFWDFKIGANSLDDFSEIAGYLHSRLDKNYFISDFGIALESASELNFYIRNIEEPNDNSLPEFMMKVENYFKIDRPGLLEKVKKLL